MHEETPDHGTSPTRRVHIIFGSKFRELQVPFANALAIYKRNHLGIDFQYMTSKMLLQLNWTVEEMVNWLLNCDFHFILTHIHQGKHFYL